jgi:hypothetical protein
MPIKIIEGHLAFCFQFAAIKFDDTVFYREHFSKIKNGISAVDIVAVDADTAYLIEIKDYRHPEAQDLKPNELIDAIVHKVISTLAAILPMKNNATNGEEKVIAGQFSKAPHIRVVLHIEIPPPRRTLKQSCYDLQAIEQALSKKLKPIDAHPKIVSGNNLRGLPWTVTAI